MQVTCHSFQNVIYDNRNLINTFFAYLLGGFAGVHAQWRT